MSYNTRPDHIPFDAFIDSRPQNLLLQERRIIVCATKSEDCCSVSWLVVRVQITIVYTLPTWFTLSGIWHLSLSPAFHKFHSTTQSPVCIVI